MAKDPDRPPRRRISLGRTWFWFSQVVTVISLISIVEDLRLWTNAISWLNERLRDLLPALQRIVAGLGRALDWVLELFRGIFRPIVEFCLQWLPFEIPEIVKDGIVVAVFVGVGLVRTELRFFNIWQLDDHDDLDLVELAAKSGVRCRARNVVWIKSALGSYSLLHITHWQVPRTELADARRRWGEALERFGPAIEVFARTEPRFGGTGDNEEELFSRKRRARAVIWWLSGSTAALVVIDRIFVR